MSDDEVRNGDSQGRQAGQGQATAPVRVRDRDDDKSNPVDADLIDPVLYLNCEFSELAFHEHVLHEARGDRNPLFERVKFLSTLTSNLDEFFMKRVGGLKQQMAADVSEPLPDGWAPSQQWSLALDRARDLLDRQSDCFHDLTRPVLTNTGIDIVGYDNLAPDERTALRDYFEASVPPTLMPLTFEPAHPFPFVSSLSLSPAVRTAEGPEEPTKFPRVKVPGSRPWSVNMDERVGDAGGGVDDDGPAGPVRFALLVAVMECNINLLFPNVEVVDISASRVTRNAEARRNEEVAEELIATTKDVFRQRRFATVVRLEVRSGTSEVVRDLLAEQLGVDDREMFERDLPLDYDALASLFDLGRSKLEVAPWTSQPHLRFAGRPADDPDSVFTEITRKDVPAHHPYHSFTGTVGTFLAVAATDSDVLAIKATIYRTAPGSEVIEMLIEAAKNGKQVAVAIELKARFDKESNLRWVRRLEEESIHVAYGTIGLKTHTKTALVIRGESDKVRLYSHIATGNYHSRTAKLYTDLGLSIADLDIGHDLVHLFSFFTGHSRQEAYRKLLVVPTNLREEMIRLVRRETDHARAGHDARVVVKMNALGDPAMIRELYEALMAGVDIDLVVRGICRLRPGIEELSEYVSVSSVVGRLLEHSRIFYFENGGEPDYYVGSADWMTHNLDHRVEVVAPVEDPEHHAELDTVFDALLSDNRRRWAIDSDGRYEQHRPGDGERVREAHRELMDQTLGAAYCAGDD